MMFKYHSVDTLSRWVENNLSDDEWRKLKIAIKVTKHRAKANSFDKLYAHISGLVKAKKLKPSARELATETHQFIKEGQPTKKDGCITS